MQVDENLSVEKYLKAIAVMVNVVGKLDVLKLHLKSMYDDKMSIVILETVIKELSDAVGMEYKMLNTVDIPKRKPLDAETKEVINEHNVNMGYAKTIPPVTPLVCEVVEKSDISENEVLSDNGFSKYMDLANKTLSEKFARKSKKTAQKSKEVVNTSKGIEFDEKTQKMTYQFVNSSHLALMVYDRVNKELTMTFKTGRTYLYKNIPMFLFDNVASIDESGTASAGGYFNQNVVKKPKQYPYTEITETEFIG